VDPELERLIKSLGDDDASVRQRAAITLNNVNDPRAVEPLIAALGDNDVFVRNFSVKALGGIGDARAVGPLIRLLDDENVLVRRSAARALGKIGDNRAVESLVQALDDGSVLVRRSAAEALGSVADPNAVDSLIRVVGDDSRVVRDAAALALVEIGEAGIGKLLNALRNWSLGPTIAEILESLRYQPTSDEDEVWLNVGKRNRQALLDSWEATRRVLLADAHSKDEGEVQNAVCAIISIGHDDVADELVKILSANGTVKIAEVFLNSGHDDLVEAARTWARRHGSDLASVAESNAIKWGSMAPS
jgi:HEAT repeat protein